MPFCLFFLSQSVILASGDIMTVVKKAGCIFFNRKNKRIGLIYRDKFKDYSFPKGHLEKGESLQECAIRETAEETKRDCVILTQRSVILKYIDGVGDLCECHYYIAEDCGKSDNTSTDTHELIWKKIDEVEDILTYIDLKQIWRRVRGRIEKEIK